jgi:CHAT domain-containing protein
VSFPGGQFVRRTSNIAESKLREDALEFRRGLTNLLERTYSAPGRRLFTALISPIRQDLKDRGIDTLVFVPDGVLRTIPMAALRDPADDTFLIQHFAIAITPGLTLMEPTPLERSRVDVLAAGLATQKTVGGKTFAALTNVPDELASLKSRFQGTVLLNKDFTRENLRESLEGREFSAVHIASHAVFEREASESYLVTFDARPMTLNDIERLIRPYQLRQKPVELLTLSACQTAAGDERAALGLAGIAVKAGARSSLASLWCVNDRATSVLMDDFYEALRTEATSEGKTVSKAKALQAAQLKMLQERGYRHPCFWAPFQLIGNWL